jgi:hypothetical protein
MEIDMKKLLTIAVLALAAANASAGNNLIMDNVTNNKKVNNAYTFTPAGAVNASRNLNTMRGTSAYRPAQATYNNQMNYVRSPSMAAQVSKGYQIFGGGAVKTRP